MERCFQPARQTLRNPLAHLRDAVGNRVLQSARAVLVHHLTRALGDRFGRKKFGGRQAAAERDNIGLQGDLEHLADRGGAHASGPRSKAHGSRDGSHTFHRIPRNRTGALGGVEAGAPACGYGLDTAMSPSSRMSRPQRRVPVESARLTTSA